MIETLTPSVVQSDRAGRVRGRERAAETRGWAGDLFGALRRHTLRPRTLLAIAAALVVAGFLARRALDINLSETWLVLRHAQLGLILLALAVFYLIFPVRAARWHVLLTNVGFKRSAGYPMPSLLGLIRLLIIAAFANSVTVAQLGDAYRAYILKREARVSFPATLGTIVAERVIDLIVLVAMLGLATIGAFTGHLPKPAADVLVVGVILAALGVVLLVGLRRLGPVVIRLIPSRWHDGYRRFEVGTVDSLQRVPLLLLYSAIAWLIEGATIFLLAAAVAAPVNALGALVAGLVASLLSSEPLTPGGLGATEAGIVLVLTGLGVSPDIAAAVAVLNRVVNYLSLAIVGPLLYLGPRLGQGIVRRSGSALSEGV